MKIELCRWKRLQHNNFLVLFLFLGYRSSDEKLIVVPDGEGVLDYQLSNCLQGKLVRLSSLLSLQSISGIPYFTLDAITKLFHEEGVPEELTICNCFTFGETHFEPLSGPMDYVRLFVLRDLQSTFAIRLALGINEARDIFLVPVKSPDFVDREYGVYRNVTLSLNTYDSQIASNGIPYFEINDIKDVLLHGNPFVMETIKFNLDSLE